MLRLLIVLFVVPVVYFLVNWLLAAIVPIEQRWIANLISALTALAAGWYIWVKLTSVLKEALPSILVGAVTVGGIGFVIGYFGPLMWAPDANQGPLLGIFILGPLGLLLGGLGGLAFWFKRRRKRG